jgi:hypothetical protein
MSCCGLAQRRRLCALAGSFVVNRCTRTKQLTGQGFVRSYLVRIFVSGNDRLLSSMDVSAKTKARSSLRYILTVTSILIIYSSLTCRPSFRFVGQKF